MSSNICCIPCILDQQGIEQHQTQLILARHKQMKTTFKPLAFLSEKLLKAFNTHEKKTFKIYVLRHLLKHNEFDTMNTGHSGIVNDRGQNYQVESLEDLECVPSYQCMEKVFGNLYTSSHNETRKHNASICRHIFLSTLQKDSIQKHNYKRICMAVWQLLVSTVHKHFTSSIQRTPLYILQNWITTHPAGKKCIEEIEDILETAYQNQNHQYLQKYPFIMRIWDNCPSTRNVADILRKRRIKSNPEEHKSQSIEEQTIEFRREHKDEENQNLYPLEEEGQYQIPEPQEEIKLNATATSLPCLNHEFESDFRFDIDAEDYILPKQIQALSTLEQLSLLIDTTVEEEANKKLSAQEGQEVKTVLQLEKSSLKGNTNTKRKVEDSFYPTYCKGNHYHNDENNKWLWIINKKLCKIANNVDELQMIDNFIDCVLNN